MAAPHVSGLFSLTYEYNRDIKGVNTMRKAIADLYAYARPQMKDLVKYGRADAYNLLSQTASEPNNCKVKRCKRCFNECGRDYECQFNRQATCRKRCRKKTSCEGNCK